MTSYTLTPTTLVNYPSASGEENVVFRVVWSYRATDGDYTCSFSGQTDLEYHSGDPFIPYADLTEEQVVEWVLSAWGTEQTSSYRYQLDAMIENQKNPPTIVLPLPWVNTANT